MQTNSFTLSTVSHKIEKKAKPRTYLLKSNETSEDLSMQSVSRHLQFSPNKQRKHYKLNNTGKNVKFRKGSIETAEE